MHFLHVIKYILQLHFATQVNKQLQKVLKKVKKSSRANIIVMLPFTWIQVHSESRVLFPSLIFINAELSALISFCAFTETLTRDHIETDPTAAEVRDKSPLHLDVNRNW